VPGKTNTDAIRALEIEVAVLGDRVENLRDALSRLETSHAKTVEALAGVTTRLTVLEAQFGDLKKALEESERKRWAVWIAVIGSFLTLAVNLLLLLLRK